MAAGFVALNETFGDVFEVSRAEAATPAMAQERAAALKDQFIMDMHTHFLRDDTRLVNFVRSREAVGKAGWNPALVDKPQTLDDLKFNNYFKEIYLDSDTKIALISSSPSEIPRDWFLTNEMMIEARDKVNKEAGARRMFAHAIFTPGWDGWLDHLQGSIERKPESIKGYTVGDNTNKDEAKHPWRMDDEKVTYKAYELCVKHGIKNVCVHKGLFPQATAERWPHLLAYADVRDVGKAAKDWPQLNFVIYHSGYRHAAGGGRKTAGGSSSRPDASPGSATWRRFRRSSASPTSMATSGNCSRRASWPSRGSAPRSWASWARAWAMIASCGAPTRCGPARRNGRSRRCAGSKSPRTCRRNTASSRSAPPTARSRPRSSAAPTPSSTTTTSASAATSGPTRTASPA